MTKRSVRVNAIRTLKDVPDYQSRKVFDNNGSSVSAGCKHEEWAQIQ